MIIEELHRSGIRVVKHVSPHVGLDLLEVIERSRKLVSEWRRFRFDGIHERWIRVDVIARKVDSRGRRPRRATPMLPACRRAR